VNLVYRGGGLTPPPPDFVFVLVFLFPLAVRARVFVPPGSFSSGGYFLQAF
jgi:hypothetical protein